MIWNKLRPGEPFRYVCDPPTRTNVQKRVPNVAKAGRSSASRQPRRCPRCSTPSSVDQAASGVRQPLKEDRNQKTEDRIATGLFDFCLLTSVFSLS